MDSVSICNLALGFNTCSSCEEQLAPAGVVSVVVKFQYMLLLRGATELCSCAALDGRISIHAPLARSNEGETGFPALLAISIHAPLARSNGNTRHRRAG